MVIARVGCINVRDLRLPWKQGYLLNYLRSLSLDEIAANEIRISDTLDLVPIVQDYEMEWEVK